MQKDKIEIIQNSLIQHGKSNDRIYIMKTDSGNIGSLIETVGRIAGENGYSKIFAKISSENANDFLKDGYKKEAVIKGYFNGEKDALLMSKYLSGGRGILQNKEEIDLVIKTAEIKSRTLPKPKKIDYEITKCSKHHSRHMADLYKSVFETYPFAIDDPKYIEKTMDENIIYFGAFKDGELIALSSCETDRRAQSVEMTDFATSAKYLGNGIALELLKHMEENMKIQNFITSYTIARAVSIPINVAFARNGYSYSGTLINNTNISGKIESMNVWVKSLK